MGTNSSGLSFLMEIGSAMEQEKLFTRSFHGCSYVLAALKSTPSTVRRRLQLLQALLLLAPTSSTGPQLHHLRPAWSWLLLPSFFLWLCPRARPGWTWWSWGSLPTWMFLWFWFCDPDSVIPFTAFSIFLVFLTWRLFFLLYMVITRHLPDNSSGLIVASISSCLA